MARLGFSDHLTLAERNGGLDLVDADGFSVARLSRQAAEIWRPRLARVEGVRVVAMVRRLGSDCQDDFRRSLRADRWEVPLGEVVWRESAT